MSSGALWRLEVNASVCTHLYPLVLFAHKPWSGVTPSTQTFMQWFIRCRLGLTLTSLST